MCSGVKVGMTPGVKQAQVWGYIYGKRTDRKLRRSLREEG